LNLHRNHQELWKWRVMLHFDNTSCCHFISTGWIQVYSLLIFVTSISFASRSTYFFNHPVDIKWQHDVLSKCKVPLQLKDCHPEVQRTIWSNLLSNVNKKQIR
jgi:hypothetical protein